MTATVTAYMPGDILFYKKSAGDITEQAISTWTKSDFIHVAIATSAMMKVESLFHGVVRTPIDGRTVGGVYYYHQKAQVNASRLADALLWLDQQVGHMYGWGDIANAFLLRFEDSISFDVNNTFDCSALATEFLLKAGGVGALQNITDPHRVTPAMLAGYLGVIPYK